MRKLSDGLIEEVREANDIVDVVGSYVSLKGHGDNLFGLCPFHNEKTPSFSVTKSKQIFYCYGCHEGGNVISFMMKINNFSFPEAMKELANRANISLPDVPLSSKEQKEINQKNALFAIYKTAAFHYSRELWSEDGKVGLEYLRSRGLSDKTIIKFGLGFAGIFKDRLYKLLKKNNFTDSIIKESGLVVFDEKNGPTDKFFNRVMFPILSESSQVIAFGGRVMGDGKPKYLNSNESSIFLKKKNLFAQQIAARSRRPDLILCEGYMDVIALHQAGFDSAIASLGTAFTDGQVDAIKKIVKDRNESIGIVKSREKKVIITLDSDYAGVDATLKAGRMLTKQGISVKILSLEPYKDPDEFIKAESVEAFNKRIDEALDFFFFKDKYLNQTTNMENIHDRSKSIEMLIGEICAEYPGEIEKEIYLRHIANKYGLSLDTVNRKYIELNTIYKEEQIKKENREKNLEDNKTVNKPTDTIDESQRLLLALFIEDKRFFERAKEIIEPKDFFDEFCKVIAEYIFKTYEEKEDIEVASIYDLFYEKEEHDKLGLILNSLKNINIKGEDYAKTFYESVEKVKEQSNEFYINKLKEEGRTKEAPALMLQSKIKLDKFMKDKKNF